MSFWTIKAVGAHGESADAAMIAEFVRLAFDPEASHELRFLPSGTSRSVSLPGRPRRGRPGDGIRGDRDRGVLLLEPGFARTGRSRLSQRRYSSSAAGSWSTSTR